MQAHPRAICNDMAEHLQHVITSYRHIATASQDQLHATQKRDAINLLEANHQLNTHLLHVVRTDDQSSIHLADCGNQLAHSRDPASPITRAQTLRNCVEVRTMVK